MLIESIQLFKPEIFMACAAMLALIAGAFSGTRGAVVATTIAVVAMTLTMTELLTGGIYMGRERAFADMVISDGFAVTFKVLCLGGLILVLLMSRRALQADLMDRFEYPVLVMLSAVGMMIMLSAHDFLMLYMGLELSSLPLYILAAFRRERALSSEAGMKYFVLGALSSGMVLFGISLVYGFGGSTNFSNLHMFMASNVTEGGIAPMANPGLVVGMVFVLAGLAFKISAVPFHMWTPDVYQGAPGPVTALFAMVPKIAALGLLIRVLYHPFGILVDDWVQMIWVLSVASMVWGAFAAVRQANIKRMLAYGSIANLGYALMGVLVVAPDGLAAAILYMGIYLVMTAGLFAILLAIRENGQMVETIDDFSGLSRTHPVPAYIIAVMMFAMAGIPPLAGFFGKLTVFSEVVSEGYIVLAVIGILSSVVAAYYYLNVIRVMFFRDSNGDVTVDMGAGQQLVALGAVLAVVVFILSPEPYYHMAQMAAWSLMPGEAPWD
jgi:NADH-quinone oxidoreductase subunit N